MRHVFFLLVLLAFAAACGGSGDPDPPKTVPPKAEPTPQQPAAAAGSPSTGSAPTPAAGDGEPAEPATPRGFDPAQADGRRTLVLQLPEARRLGGFSVSIRFDGARMAMEDPQLDASLSGYFCAHNRDRPGELRYNCVGLPNADVEGVLARMPVAFKGRAPSASDFAMAHHEIVDDFGNAIANTRLVLAVEESP